MPNTEINVPKWTLIEWRNFKNAKPKEGDRCLVVSGSDIHQARFLNGAFFLGDWTRALVVSFWSPWPKPPIS
jgi:hypothetical protein